MQPYTALLQPRSRAPALRHANTASDAGAQGGPMETLEVPANMVGKLIGRGGETIRNLQLSSDTRIQVDHSGEGDIKRVTISGMSRCGLGGLQGPDGRGGARAGRMAAAGARPVRGSGRGGRRGACTAASAGVCAR